MTGAYREFRVPTTAFHVEILTADGRTFLGQVFVPDVAATHRGLQIPPGLSLHPGELDSPVLLKCCQRPMQSSLLLVDV